MAPIGGSPLLGGGGRELVSEGQSGPTGLGGARERAHKFSRSRPQFLHAEMWVRGKGKHPAHSKPTE